VIGRLGRFVAAASFALPCEVVAQSGDESGLAKQSQNPIGALVSVPIQYNFTMGGSLSGETAYNTRVQPVAPLALGKSWNVITRPIITFYNLRRADGRRSRGVGDIELQEFFVSTKPAAVMVGFGPLFSFPTATIDEVHTGAWAAGPALVIVRDTGPWVLSALLTQAWSFTGDQGHAEINTFGVQPVINYNVGGGWAFTTAPQIVTDFTIDGGTQWTVPVGAGISKVTAIGTQSVSLAVQYYNNVIRPRDSGATLFRFVTSFLFPNVPAKK